MRNLRLYDADIDFKAYEQEKGGDGLKTRTIFPGISLTKDITGTYFNPHDASVEERNITIKHLLSGTQVEVGEQKEKTIQASVGVETDIKVNDKETLTNLMQLNDASSISSSNTAEFWHASNINTEELSPGENYFNAIYKSTSSGSTVKLYNASKTALSTYLVDILVDGISLSGNVVSEYTFQQSGLHVVKYLFANTPTNGWSWGSELFKTCSDLIWIGVPDNVTSLGSDAFAGCSGLTGVTLPNSVTQLAWRAFSGCSSLSDISVGTGITYLGEGVFGGCSSLTELTFTDSLTHIAASAFTNCTSLTSVTIGSGVTQIENYAFFNCASLLSITIPGSVESWENFTFKNCSSLTSVTIESGVTYIGVGTFTSCKSLISVILPDSVYSIGYQTFYECFSLTGLTLPPTIETIGMGMFYNCRSLASITIPSSVTGINSDAFSKCVFQTGNFINNSSLNAQSNSYWGAKIVSTEQSDGLLISGNVAYNCRFWSSAITIPSSVTKISGYCFSACTRLVNITIPSSVTTIGEGAFAGCSSLSSVVIPNSIRTIPASTFYNCSSLTGITIPSSITSFGSSAFNGCSSLPIITIPSSVTAISNYCFSKCTSLSKIIAQRATAPTIQSKTFQNIKTWGTLQYPQGSDYSVWLSTDDYYLGKYNWTGQEITV